MLEYLFADIICSEKRTVFRERSSRKTVGFEEQIMSKDKYPSLFSQPNWGYCVYYSPVLKIGEYPRIFPSFSWGIFVNATPLDQSRASENIWWSINICIEEEFRKKKKYIYIYKLRLWAAAYHFLVVTLTWDWSCWRYLVVTLSVTTVGYLVVALLATWIPRPLS